MLPVECPECGNKRYTKLKRCSCGWRQQEVSERGEDDHRCQYVFNHRRCPLSGSISPSLHANSRWYCILHWRVLDDPKAGEEKLIYAENNCNSILASHKDWRRRLHPERTTVMTDAAAKKAMDLPGDKL